MKFECKIEFQIDWKHWLFGVNWWIEPNFTLVAFHFGPALVIIK